MQVCKSDNKTKTPHFKKIADFLNIDAKQLEILWQMNQLNISLNDALQIKFPEFDTDVAEQPSSIVESDLYQLYYDAEKILCQYVRTLEIKVFALLYASLLLLDDKEASFKQVVRLMHTVLEEIKDGQLERLYNIFMVYYPSQRSKGMRLLAI